MPLAPDDLIGVIIFTVVVLILAAAVFEPLEKLETWLAAKVYGTTDLTRNDDGILEVTR